MDVQLTFNKLNADQQNWYLDLILRNRNLYNEFLDFAEKRHQAEEVRFLRTMTEIPWNGNTPLTQEMARGVFATYIRPESFYQINIPATQADQVRHDIDTEQLPDWGPIIMEARRLLRHNRLIVDFLAAREKKAQAARV